MNWNQLAKYVKSKDEFSEWGKLKKYFGQDKIDYLKLIEYHVKNYYPHNTLRYTVINRITKAFGVQIPPQYATCIVVPQGYPNLDKFLSLLKALTTSHSVYAYCAAMFVYPQTTLNKLKANSDLSWCANAPKWLTIILDRQWRLCRNAFLDESAPFFFVKEREEIKPVVMRHILNTSKLLEGAIKLSLKEYITLYHKFAGMGQTGIILEGSNVDIYTELKQRRRRNILSPVAVYRFANSQRIVYTHGICLQELENGIYLVATKFGKLVVPFYLMDIPKLRVSYPPKGALKELYELGYIPEEDWPEITNFNKLVQYKVKL